MNDFITPDELGAGIEAGSAPTIVDVRPPDAYAAGHLPGAVNIPIDDLPARMEEIVHDRPVVVY